MTETELPLIQTSSVCVFSAVAEQNVFFFWGGGGGATWPSEIRGLRGKNRENF